MYEMIQAQLNEIVPFARHIGVEITALSQGEAEATLSQQDELSNHIGSMHAGALFTLGEAASGAAMAGLLGPQVMELRPVATTANIRYEAIARGKMTARAQTSADRDEVFERLEAENKARFEVDVELLDADATVCCRMQVQWHVSRKSS